jgi:hypothetical protein
MSRRANRKAQASASVSLEKVSSGISKKRAKLFIHIRVQPFLVRIQKQASGTQSVPTLYEAAWMPHPLYS